jgi:hypothetical protein
MQAELGRCRQMQAEHGNRTKMQADAGRALQSDKRADAGRAWQSDKNRFRISTLPTHASFRQALFATKKSYICYCAMHRPKDEGGPNEILKRS